MHLLSITLLLLKWWMLRFKLIRLQSLHSFSDFQQVYKSYGTGLVERWPPGSICKVLVDVGWNPTMLTFNGDAARWRITVLYYLVFQALLWTHLAEIFILLQDMIRNIATFTFYNSLIFRLVRNLLAYNDHVFWFLPWISNIRLMLPILSNS